MFDSLRLGSGFDAARYVNRFSAKRHDHFLIPAGTVHCSGGGSLVLEISATPYIFTFKLWDWGRLGLDGRPRPLHIDHGEANVRWERDRSWCEREAINQVHVTARGDRWVTERTGLHPTEFIETRRTWFWGPVSFPASDSVQVCNLVEGEKAVIESPDHAWEPFEIHYAETFVVPTGAGPCAAVPSEGTPHALIRATT
jgi:mannose-6-phosphate isomerase class I